MTDPTLVGVAGIGGWANAHHEALWALEKAGVLRVVGACDPAAANLGEVCARFGFQARGVQVFESFEAMLDAIGGAQPWVSVAAPIPVHAAMHRACVERGLACYLEKPPTLDPAELEEMISTDLRGEFRTQVGFNHIAQPQRLELKRRLLAGDFGRLQRVSFLGAWKRGSRYFTRSPWVGRLLLEGRPFMDSCLGNAMAHHVHNLLFFAGRDHLYSWADCAALASEFYRANAIEGPDTVFAKGQLTGGVEMRLALTHACAGADLSEEVLECELATILISPMEGIEISWKDGRRERVPLPSDFPLQGNLGAFVAYLRGDSPRPSTLLEDCRPVVRVNAMAFAAARRVNAISPEWLSRSESSSDEFSLAIVGIVGNLRELVEDGQFPSESACPWGHPGGQAVPAELSGLVTRLHEIAAASLPPVPRSPVRPTPLQPLSLP